MNQNTPKKAGYIEKLRAKPAEYRHTYALFVSLAVTLLIMSVWVISLVSKLSTGNVENSASASESVSVFSVIKEQYKDVVEGASSQATNGDENLVQ